MSEMLRTQGRLPWPPVIAVILMAATIFVFDLAWRTISLPFESLMIWGAIVGISEVGLILVVVRQTKRGP